MPACRVSRPIERAGACDLGGLRAFGSRCCSAAAAACASALLDDLGADRARLAGDEVGAECVGGVLHVAHEAVLRRGQVPARRATSARWRSSPRSLRRGGQRRAMSGGERGALRRAVGALARGTVRDHGLVVELASALRAVARSAASTARARSWPHVERLRSGTVTASRARTRVRRRARVSASLIVAMTSPLVLGAGIVVDTVQLEAVLARWRCAARFLGGVGELVELPVADLHRLLRAAAAGRAGRCGRRPRGRAAGEQVAPLGRLVVQEPRTRPAAARRTGEVRERQPSSRSTAGLHLARCRRAPRRRRRRQPLQDRFGRARLAGPDADGRRAVARGRRTANVERRPSPPACRCSTARRSSRSSP